MNARLIPSPSALRQRRQSGFSLVELLVVIAIIAVLVGIAVPVILKVRERGRSVQSLANLRQIYSGMATYQAENNGDFPAAEWPDDNWWLGPKGIARYIAPDKPSWWPWLEYDPVKQYDKRGTAFKSPNWEGPDFKWPDGSTPISYGYNQHIANRKANRKLLLLYPPAKTLLLADASGSNSLCLDYGIKPKYSVNARNGASKPGARDGSAFVTFLDGHTESVNAKRINTLNNNPGDPWWGVPQ